VGLSPDDIVHYPLKQSVRGYSVAQVDGLLDEVADTVERLEAEVADLRQRLQRADERVADVSETEATLKRTLVTAQRAAEQSLDEARQQAADLMDGAQREAASLVEEARGEAEEIRAEAAAASQAEEAETRRRRQTLEGHIEALRLFERDYRSRLRAELEDHLRLLDEPRARPPEVPEPQLTVRVHDDAGGTGGDPSVGDGDAGEVGSGAPPEDGAS
jgi:cell division initiation protein